MEGCCLQYASRIAGLTMAVGIPTGGAIITMTTTMMMMMMITIMIRRRLILGGRVLNRRACRRCRHLRDSGGLVSGPALPVVRRLDMRRGDSKRVGTRRGRRVGRGRGVMDGLTHRQCRSLRQCNHRRHRRHRHRCRQHQALALAGLVGDR